MELIETRGTLSVQRKPGGYWDYCDGRVDIRYTHDSTGTTVSFTFRDFMITCDAAKLRKLILEENDMVKKV